MLKFPRKNCSDNTAGHRFHMQYSVLMDHWDLGRWPSAGLQSCPLTDFKMDMWPFVLHRLIWTEIFYISGIILIHPDEFQHILYWIRQLQRHPTSIPPNSKLLERRYKTIHPLEYIRHVLLPDNGLCVRAQDPKSTKRKLHGITIQFAFSCIQRMDQLSLRTKWPKSDRTPTATTDASVLRSIASIGGLITIFYDIQTGSSESSTVPDFQQILVSMTTNMQRYFLYYETLTLPAVLSLFAQHFLRADLPFPFTTFQTIQIQKRYTMPLFSTMPPFWTTSYWN